jgi:hypothetical protein
LRLSEKAVSFFILISVSVKKAEIWALVFGLRDSVEKLSLVEMMRKNEFVLRRKKERKQKKTARNFYISDSLFNFLFENLLTDKINSGKVIINI